MSEYLKCDAVGCDHVEDVAQITADMVGRPCPKCGASLLTEADWNMWNSVFRPGIDAAHRAGLIAIGSDVKPGDPGTIQIHHHHGETTVRHVAKAPTVPAEEPSNG